jgi:hypothetical protein
MGSTGKFGLLIEYAGRNVVLREKLGRTHKYGYAECMKTTVEIPDDLYRRAKSRAAESGQSFRSLLVDALRARLCGQGNTASLDDAFGALSAEKEAVYEVQRALAADGTQSGAAVCDRTDFKCPSRKLFVRMNINPKNDLTKCHY